ncbi:hypothetical protein [Maribacter luteus]|uniref:Uncharacterized protein n=1 Tax=Maribacter luteus TaxID=2594478 RepID=A0A6I2MPV1_9FLAO|nr:hypothetical protein [Maribacter luteus]MRX64882.1 hypothetical protein [Maribacter luteus]
MGIKEFSEDYEALLSLQGEEKKRQKEALDKKYSKDNIGWVYVLVEGRLEELDYTEYTQKDRNKINRKIGFSPLLVGGGMTWLQPYLKNGARPMGQRPYGCFVSSTGTPKVIKTLWTDRQNNELPDAVAFGSQVRLHIYTQDLYGQELTIGLVDRDIFNPNDELSVTSNNEDAALADAFVISTAFRREITHKAELTFEKNFNDIIKGQVTIFGNKQTHVQKTSIDVFVDPYWAIVAGKSLKIFPTVMLEATGKFIEFERQYLSVKENAKKYEGPGKLGNVSVQVGEIETNIKAFSPCRYKTIVATLPNQEPFTLFSEDGQVNTGASVINTGMVTNGSNKKVFKIEVTDIDNEGCSETETGKMHENNVIDTSVLDELNIEYEQTKGKTASVSFVPIYPYKYLNNGNPDFFNFFISYFPVISNNNGLFFELPITTCAYQKKVKFIVFPDVHFAMHLQVGKVDKKLKNFYKEIEVPIISGLDKEFEQAQKHQDFIYQYLKYIPVFALHKFIQELIMDYLKGEAAKFGVGLHGYHSFTTPIGPGLKKGTDYEQLDYGVEYPLVPKAIIAYGLLCSVVMDALLLYFSGGGYAAVKAGAKATSVAGKTWKQLKLARRRYKQYKTAKKLATGNFVEPARSDRTEFEFIAPKIRRITGMGFVQDKQGAISLELTEKILASPLFAMSYTIKGDWGDFLAAVTGVTGMFNGLEVANNVVGEILKIKSIKDDVNKAQGKTETDTRSNTEKAATGIAKRTGNRQDFFDRLEDKIQLDLKEFAKKYGQEGEIEIYFSGFIDAHYELTANNAKGLNLSLYDENGALIKNYDNTTGVSYGCDYGITAGVIMSFKSEVTIKWTKLAAYTPKFLGDGLYDTNIDFELEGEMGGSIHYECTYTRKGQAPTMKQQVIICTGIRGMAYAKIKLEIDKKVGENKKWELKVGKKREKDAPRITDRYNGEYTELLKDFTIPFDPVPVFDDSLKNYFD